MELLIIARIYIAPSTMKLQAFVKTEMSEYCHCFCQEWASRNENQSAAVACVIDAMFVIADTQITC